MPASLEESLQRAEQHNPTLMISNSKIAEAEAKTKLAKSDFLPRVNLELSSSYNDNVEGEDSWRQNHQAMVVFRWNLFNGGQDTNAVNAAVAKTYENRFNRKDTLAELQDTTTSAWATLNALHRQKQVYRAATIAGKQTFAAYMQQFSVSRRSLLDVLNAEREFFQSAQRFIAAGTDKVITAYFILQLEGALEVGQVASTEQSSKEFKEMLQVIEFPPTRGLLLSDHPEPTNEPVGVVQVHALVIEEGPMMGLLSQNGSPH